MQAQLDAAVREAVAQAHADGFNLGWQAEREACARWAEQVRITYDKRGSFVGVEAATWIRDAIRARGQASEAKSAERLYAEREALKAVVEQLQALVVKGEETAQSAITAATAALDERDAALEQVADLKKSRDPRHDGSEAAWVTFKRERDEARAEVERLTDTAVSLSSMGAEVERRLVKRNAGLRAALKAVQVLAHREDVDVIVDQALAAFGGEP